MRRLNLRLKAVALAAALGVLAAPAAAIPAAHDAAAGVRQALRSEASSSRQLGAFYAGRDFRPIWFRGGALTVPALRAIEFVSTSRLDGLDPGQLGLRRLARSLKRAGRGDPEDIARAELQLSGAFVAYVRALHRPGDAMAFVDPELAPSPPPVETILASVAVGEPIERVTRMHPIYLRLRQAYASWLDRAGALDPAERARDARIRINLERARLLPSPDRGRHILVDAGAMRLWMYDGAEEQGSMKVIVGKPHQPTPMMAGLIRYAAVNPYWNVPPDLVQERIAPHVVDQGLGYLKSRRYQVLSDWSDDATVVDPGRIDWKAVLDGTAALRVRQLPGPANAMGQIKFMFPNGFGVYLHDTPNKELFAQSTRLFSGGCVRLEDAPRLAQWLFGRMPAARRAAAEQQVPLADPVPVYITYLTVVPGDDGALVFRDDPYRRDGGAPMELAGTATE